MSTFEHDSRWTATICRLHREADVRDMKEAGKERKQYRATITVDLPAYGADDARHVLDVLVDAILSERNTYPGIKARTNVRSITERNA